MQATDRISFRFEHNGTFHNDLVLQIGEQEWRCDSYYLQIDRGMLPDREDAAKVRAVLRRLLDQWCTALGRLSDGQSCYLPYDFSDQYTGWLRCTLDGDRLRVQLGTAGVQGHSLPPSQLDGFLDSIPAFRPCSHEVIISRNVFLRSLRADPATP